MRLTTDHWELIAYALGFLRDFADEGEAQPVLDLIGSDGHLAAEEGVEPAGGASDAAGGPAEGAGGKGSPSRFRGHNRLRDYFA